MKNAVFWDVTPCGSCKNHHQSNKNLRASNSLAVTSNRSALRRNTVRRRYVHPKRRFLQQPRSETSQKTAFFILFSYFFNYIWDWSGTKCTITAAVYCTIVQPLNDDNGDYCGAISGMYEWHGNNANDYTIMDTIFLWILDKGYGRCAICRYRPTRMPLPS
jgi:hypothetical protein